MLFTKVRDFSAYRVKAQTRASISFVIISFKMTLKNEPKLESVINNLVYFEKMHELKKAFNEYLFLNVHEIEAHFACYPVGSFYQKHLDHFSQVSGNQTRQLSSVLYLNKDWQASNGGELRLYLKDNEFIDILPNAGRLVLFLSAQFWHEVLPAKVERLSLTGWFRTRN